MLNDDTEDVKQSKISTLIKEYMLFRMEFGEIVKSIQMCFINLINKLNNLGKNLSNKDFANKVLKSMRREW